MYLLVLFYIPIVEACPECQFLSSVAVSERNVESAVSAGCGADHSTDAREWYGSFDWVLTVAAEALRGAEVLQGVHSCVGFVRAVPGSGPIASNQLWTTQPKETSSLPEYRTTW